MKVTALKQFRDIKLENGAAFRALEEVDFVATILHARRIPAAFAAAGHVEAPVDVLFGHRLLTNRLAHMVARESGVYHWYTYKDDGHLKRWAALGNGGGRIANLLYPTSHCHIVDNGVLHQFEETCLIDDVVHVKAFNGVFYRERDDGGKWWGCDGRGRLATKQCPWLLLRDFEVCKQFSPGRFFANEEAPAAVWDQDVSADVWMRYARVL